MNKDELIAALLALPLPGDTEVYFGSHYRDVPIDSVTVEGVGRNAYPLILIAGHADAKLVQF